MPRDIRIGILGRADNTGLGIETWEFCRHFPETKVMIASFESLNDPKYRIYPDRFKNPVIIDQFPDDPFIEEFLEDIDLLFTIETPYNPRAYPIAREMGVTSVLRINYEWLRPEYNPDFFIAPSLYHYEDIPKNKLCLPFPINREVLPFKERRKACKFIHIAGNMKAAYDRNGTEVFLKAIPHIKGDIEIVIKSQVPIRGVDDSRVRIDVRDHENYWDIWEDADVYVSPRRYAGQSLPLNEAMSLGMAVMMTDMEPQSQFLPKDLLIKPRAVRKLRICREIEIADIDPQDIAGKIDGIAGKDISRYSQISDHIAENWSWQNLKPFYATLFQKICSSN